MMGYVYLDYMRAYTNFLYWVLLVLVGAVVALWMIANFWKDGK